MSDEDKPIPEVDAIADDPLARWRFLNARREAVIGAIRARRGDEGDYWTARAAAPGAQMRVDPAHRFPPLDWLLDSGRCRDDRPRCRRGLGALRDPPGACRPHGDGGRTL
jgi:hypothetical protein